MRTQFDEELKDLFDDLSHLTNAAHESVQKSIQALNNRDKDLAHELFSDDLRINALTIDVEQSAYKLIALQQPVSEDLRKVFTVLIASNDVERIADHAVSIARQVIRREEDQVAIEEIENIINKMAEIVTEMLDAASRSVQDQDSKLAQEVAQRDNEVDALLKEIYHMATRRMEVDTDTISPGIGYINIANNLERIGDYVTNICERVIYLDTGTIVELN